MPPDMASFQAATADVDWQRAQGFQASLTDAPRPDAYPIMAASFVLIHQYPKDAPRRRDVLAFFQWALKNGGDMALRWIIWRCRRQSSRWSRAIGIGSWASLPSSPSLVQRGTRLKAQRPDVPTLGAIGFQHAFLGCVRPHGAARAHGNPVPL